jgi:hypothetical protein
VAAASEAPASARSKRPLNATSDGVAQANAAPGATAAAGSGGAGAPPSKKRKASDLVAAATTAPAGPTIDENPEAVLPPPKRGRRADGSTAAPVPATTAAVPPAASAAMPMEPEGRRSYRGGSSGAVAATAPVATAAAPAPAASAAASARGAASSTPVAQGSGGLGSAGKRRHGPLAVVAFSGFDEGPRKEAMKSTILGLRGRVVKDDDEVATCTHVVVAKPVKRTTKLLIGVSVPSAVLVDERWVRACHSAGHFVDGAPYYLEGEHSSSNPEGAQWTFDATVSRQRRREGGCLAGLHFYVTDEVKPRPEQLKLILEQAGGTVLTKAPSAKDAHETLVVTTEAEKKSWQRLAKLPRVKALRVDHVLDGVLQQQLDTESGQLEP